MNESTFEQGTLVVAWSGPSLPIEVVSRMPAVGAGVLMSADGVTGRAVTLPPGEYLVRATLPAWTGLQRATVTVPVRVDAGQETREDLGGTITAYLASLNLTATLPFGQGSVFVRPRSERGSGLEVGVTLSSDPSITANLDPSVIVAQGAALANHLRSLDWSSGVSALSGSLVRNGLSAIADRLLIGHDAELSCTGAPSFESSTPVSTVWVAEQAANVVAGAALDTLPAPRRFEAVSGLLAAEWQGQSILAVVPVDRTGGTVATFLPEHGADPDTPPRLGLTFDDPDLDTLWLFMRDNAVRESRRLASSVPGNAKWLDGELAVLERSPLTATLDAYVLLRTNWREDLHAFTTQALAHHTGLADLRVIHAEVLGRLGRHAEAAMALAELGRGVQPWPLFRPGMAYALARVGLYLDADGGEAAPTLDEAVRQELSHVAARLRAICTAMDPSQIPLVLTRSSLSGLLAGRDP